LEFDPAIYSKLMPATPEGLGAENQHDPFRLQHPLKFRPRPERIPKIDVIISYS
jgi:hypothetical protein